MKSQPVVERGDGAGGRISLTVGGRAVGSTAVVSGKQDWTRVETAVRVEAPGKGALRLEAFRKPDGNVFFDDVELRRLVPPVVGGFLLYPNYRGMLFSDRPQTIRMAVTFNPADQPPDSETRVRLRLQRGADVVATVVEDRPSPTFRMSLHVAHTPPGEYDLVLEAIDARSGEVLAQQAPYRVVKLQSASRPPSHTYVDHDNVLVLGGRRAFPLGIYDTGGYGVADANYAPRMAAIAEAPLDLYINYQLGGAPVAAIKALTTALQGHGMSYLHTVNAWFPASPYFRQAPGCRGTSPVALGPLPYAKCMAEAVDGMRGFAGWYTADEAPVALAPQVFEQYGALKSGSPWGVTFIAQNLPKQLDAWRDAADVIGVDAYPIYNIPEGQPSPLRLVIDAVDDARSAVVDSRPVWGVIQYFQFGSRGHWPTYDELRSMSYLAVAGGAKGLLYWSYGARALATVTDPARKAELWQRLVRVTKEIKSIEPALLAADAPDILRVRPTDAALRLLARRVGDVRYLILVNAAGQPLEGTFGLGEPAGRVEVLGGTAAVVPSDDGAFRLAFQPYEAHVLRILR